MASALRPVAVIVCAAGSGTRFGGQGGVSKLDEDLCGKAVLLRAVEAVAATPGLVQLIVAGPAADDAHDRFLARYGEDLAALGATTCRGGAQERYETVAAALAHVGGEARAVLVHDAARPCVSGGVIARVLAGLVSSPAVVPAIPVADTLRRGLPRSRAAGGGLAASGGVASAGLVDRRGLYAMQTPQGFEADLLRRAYAQDDLVSTDDAGLVERLGEAVVLVEGDARNLKITRPTDLVIARSIWPTIDGR